MSPEYLKLGIVYGAEVVRRETRFIKAVAIVTPRVAMLECSDLLYATTNEDISYGADFALLRKHLVTEAIRWRACNPHHQLTNMEPHD